MTSPIFVQRPEVVTGRGLVLFVAMNASVAVLVRSDFGGADKRAPGWSTARLPGPGRPSL